MIRIFHGYPDSTTSALLNLNLLSGVNCLVIQSAKVQNNVCYSAHIGIEIIIYNKSQPSQ